MIIGGCIYPTYSVEGVMGLLARLTPHAHAVMGYVKLMTEGVGLAGVLPNVGVLLGMAAGTLMMDAVRICPIISGIMLPKMLA